MADTTPPIVKPTPPKIDPKHAEPKPRVGPHGFDSHITNPVAEHQSGAVPLKGVPGVRVLPSGKSGLEAGPK